MPNKCIGHIPVSLTDAGLPVKPGFAQQFFQNPTIDVAASVVPDIDNQAVAVVYR